MSRRILLVAPNLSRKMGGEALKALQICEGLVERGHAVRQVTHARVRHEMTRDYPHLDIVYLPDDRLQVWLSTMRLQFLLSVLNAWQLARLARGQCLSFQPEIVHVTSPISPVLPLFPMAHPCVVLGPINGNIAYPPAFAAREPFGRRLARLSMPIVQRVFKWLDRQKRAATILVAGGPRTQEALRYAGVTPDRMIDTLDSGIAPSLFELRPILQDGRSGRFVFVGRLVAYKACDLAIEALALAPDDLTLDVIGEGPERVSLEALVAARGLKDRVRFLGWQTPDDAYYRMLQTYRGLILPTLAEANGIVFQEAMTIGLPIVAVDWGGASQLLDNGTAILVKPTSREVSITALCEAITHLAGDFGRANDLAQTARRRAEVQGFSWPRLLTTWEAVYDSACGSNPR